jgi:succinate dehydrogenase hydrophobic anchor subunit
LARTGLVLVVIAAGFLIAALVLLCRAAIEALIALGLEPAWANLSVAGAALVLALIFGLTGARALRPERLRPERTMRAIQRDAATLHKVFQDEP